MCYWKQWRWVRTKIKHLLDLGVSLKTAIQHGVSSKSFWHMARTPALQQALSNAWLQAGTGQRERPVVQGPGLRDLNDGFVERADSLNRPLRTRNVSMTLRHRVA